MENKVNEAAAMAQNTETENAAANTAAAIVEPTAAAQTKPEAKKAGKETKEAKKPKSRKEAREELEEKQLEALAKKQELEAK